MTGLCALLLITQCLSPGNGKFQIPPASFPHLSPQTEDALRECQVDPPQPPPLQHTRSNRWCSGSSAINFHYTTSHWMRLSPGFFFAPVQFLLPPPDWLLKSKQASISSRHIYDNYTGETRQGWTTHPPGVCDDLAESRALWISNQCV